MTKTFELKIVTPEKVLYRDTIESVSVMTADGEITVLANHLPIISAIVPGELRIKKDGKVLFFSVTHGVLEMDGKTATLLTDAAERAEAIDEKRAEEARQRAQVLMAEKRGDAEGYTDAVAEMERALSRVRIARKRRHGSTSSFDSHSL